MATFYRVQHPTIQDGLVVRWKTFDDSFEVSASRNGVMIHGAVKIRDGHQSHDIQSVISHAWQTVSMIKSGTEIPQDFSIDPDCVCEIRESRFMADDIVIMTRC